MRASPLVSAKSSQHLGRRWDVRCRFDGIDVEDVAGICTCLDLTEGLQLFPSIEGERNDPCDRAPVLGDFDDFAVLHTVEDLGCLVSQGPDRDLLHGYDCSIGATLTARHMTPMAVE